MKKKLKIKSNDDDDDVVLVRTDENSIFVSIREFVKIIHQILKSDRDVIIGIGGFTGEGKCQRAGSKVLMASGEWRNIEDVKVGNLVLSPQKDGTHIYSKVAHTHTRYSNKNYTVCQRNRQKKELYSCAHNHLIPVYYKVFPRKNRKRLAKDAYWELRNYEAEQLSQLCDSHTKIGFSSFAIERFLNRKNCQVEPYALGLYLGDGNFTDQLGITGADIPPINEVNKFYPIMSLCKKKDTKAIRYRFSLFSDFAKQLTFYGLRYKRSGNKFIPKAALLSDVNYRKRLLAGLIDSDGYYYHGGYYITTKSKQLANDILDLVYSLGGRGNIRHVSKSIKKINFKGKYYEVSFYLHNLDLPLLVKYKRKKCSCVYLASNRVDITLKNGDPCQVYGFTLDSPSGYYVTDNWMVTHNSTFATQLLRDYSQVSKTYWEMDRTTWSRKEMMRWIDGDGEKKKGQLPEYSAILADELFNMFYRRKWFDDDQIEAIATFNMCRDRHLLIAGNVPDFWDLDTGFVKRVRFYIYITERGKAWVFQQENNPFTKDPWNVTENKKIFRKHKNPYNVPNFICEIPFDDWTPEEKRDYYGIRNIKRVEALKEAKEQKKEKYTDIKLQRDNAINMWYADRRQLSEALKTASRKDKKLLKEWSKPPTNQFISDVVGVSPEAIRLIRIGEL